ncbi:uncharacterized protein L3040_000286 [Drepanopeziza brunnea f. sp. 'multigermtubi']|uniref:uncharacterized protein n=1 Tax=Drepanopeziza brunnea f. sp. 'multigermtubi' TaxID=698441 RepID=UPI00239D0346|nr:hypothetical protein L3040_000286 [Drepanopeziza brunnea f. sp. 'multigermtubi']
MTKLILLPNEILHHVFRQVDPVDLAHLSRSCTLLNKNIAGDGQLFKAVYCYMLDAPPESQAKTFDYKNQLREFVKCRRILDSSTEKPMIFNTPDEEALLFLADWTTRFLRTAHSTKSRNLGFLHAYFSRLNPKNLTRFLCHSSTWDRARLLNLNPLYETPFAVRQASAKLHVLYGKPLLKPTRNAQRKGPTVDLTPNHKDPYPYAVSKVYDLRNYTEETMWGPYLADGYASVDWEKLEAVMLLLGYNAEVFKESVGENMLPAGFSWDEGWAGATPGSYRSTDIYGSSQVEEFEEVIEGEGDEATEPVVDPYNIGGTWMRVVCFLDFHELFAYNFTNPATPTDRPRPALQTTEAIRLISMELRVTHTEPPGPDDGQELPVVFFEGISRSLHSPRDVNANSNIKGCVRLTREGEVRWQSMSIYNGEERWRSEGIQVGGVGSARGVLGHWFDKDHDVHGPAGPTGFYKISDQIKNYASDSDTEEPPVLDVEIDDDVEDVEEVQAFIGQLAEAIGMNMPGLHAHVHIENANNSNSDGDGGINGGGGIAGGNGTLQGILSANEHEHEAEERGYAADRNGFSFDD